MQVLMCVAVVLFHTARATVAVTPDKNNLITAEISPGPLPPETQAQVVNI